MSTIAVIPRLVAHAAPSQSGIFGSLIFCLGLGKALIHDHYQMVKIHLGLTLPIL